MNYNSKLLIKSSKFLTILILTAALFFAFIAGSKVLTNTSPSSDLPKYPISIGSTRILVELADTDEKRSKGLSQRPSLNENEGMLFDFKVKDSFPIIWMKGMRFGMDIIWINDGKIIKIEANVPPPKEGTQDSDLPKYWSNSPADFILEVKAGFAESNDIKVGSKVDLSSVKLSL